MPMFDYACLDCHHEQEHFVFDIANSVRRCSKCDSEKYIRQLPIIVADTEYRDADKNYQKTIAPHIQDTYKKIGQEAASGDSKTLENIFGNSHAKSIQ